MKLTPIAKVSPRQVKELALRTRLKRELIAEHGAHCMTCGGKPDWRGLAIHHKTHLSQGGKTEKANLILLCGKCHNQAHGIKEKGGSNV